MYDDIATNIYFDTDFTSSDSNENSSTHIAGLINPSDTTSNNYVTSEESQSNTAQLLYEDVTESKDVATPEEMSFQPLEDHFQQILYNNLNGQRHLSIEDSNDPDKSLDSLCKLMEGLEYPSEDKRKAYVNAVKLKEDNELDFQDKIKLLKSLILYLRKFESGSKKTLLSPELELLQLKVKEFGKNDNELISSYETIAGLRGIQKNETENLEYYDKVFKLVEERDISLTDSDVNNVYDAIGLCYFNLSLCYKKENDPIKASDNYEKAKKIYVEIYGLHHEKLNIFLRTI